MKRHTNRSTHTLRRRLRRPRCKVAASTRLAMEPLEDRRLLATFSVSNTLDSGPGSLRQAVLDANASPGEDRVAVNETDTIRLTSGPIVITDDVFVDGMLLRSNIDAGGSSGIFVVDDGTAANIQVTIGDLILRGGNAENGGAILNRESLILRGITVTGNVASDDGGAVYNEGTLEFDTNVKLVDNSAARGGGVFNAGEAIVSFGRITGNSAELGGGIYNVGKVTTDDANFYGDFADRGGVFGNFAKHGGGIFNDGVVALEKTQVAGNTAQGNGGGIYNTSIAEATIVASTLSGNAAFGDGGGVYNAGTTTIANSTISGGFASRGGGLFNGSGATSTATQATIADNAADSGGGIFNDGQLTLTNSIVADSASGADVQGAGTTTTAGRNLVEDGSISAVDVLNVDPLLGQLGGNGGPTTTHPLLPGSKAIDAGASALALDPGGSPLSFDQRSDGFPRIVGASVDLGAFELQTVLAAAITPVSPDPRDTPVDSIEIVFGEPVTGFDVGDLNLELSFDGKGNLLSLSAFGAAPVLSTSDHQTFTLSGLASRTATAGPYTLSINPVGADIVGVSGAPLARPVVEKWTSTSDVDLSPPIVKITPVSPDPTTVAVDSVEIVFSEPVIGFDLGDLILDQQYDGLGNLLTGGESLASGNGRTYLLSGLAPLTSAEATYVLSLNAATSGITDAAGNGLAINGHERWTREFGPSPTVDIVDVTPDPLHDSAVDSLEIVFSEPVTGFDLGDLVLERELDGKGDLLSIAAFGASPTLATSDGQSYTLSGLASRTATGGFYTLTLSAEGSGIVGAGGFPLVAGAVEQWGNVSYTDVDPPVASFAPVDPNPRPNPVSGFQLNFSEPVYGLDLGDLNLDLAGDGKGNLLTSNALLYTTDQRVWILRPTSDSTGDAGQYTLRLSGSGTGIVDAAGNPLLGGATVQWTTLPPPTLIVDTYLDVVDGPTHSISALLANRGADGKISLREAIQATNNTIGKNEIEFDPQLAGKTIVLGGSELLINDNVAITGLGADLLTIDGAGRSRVLAVQGEEVWISGMTITGGRNDGGNGGGIFSSADLLTLDHVDVVHNSAKHGSGIYASDDLHMIGGRIAENDTGNGGAFENISGSWATFREVSITGNEGFGVLVADIGGLVKFYDGEISYNDAGVYNRGETIIVNSTIYGNLGDGARLASRRITLLQSTVAGNGRYGLVIQKETIAATLSGTILADNGIEDFWEDFSVGFQFSLRGVNLVADGSLTAPNVLNVDPLLGPLADNGGPTRTAALLPGSPAIDSAGTISPRDDAGNLIVFDQRGVGFPRVVGSSVDLGAFEAPAAEELIEVLAAESAADMRTLSAGAAIAAVLGDAEFLADLDDE